MTATVRVPRHLSVAFAEQGVKEVAGQGSNPRIVEYHSATALRATHDDIPWCAAFVCWVLRRCGIRHPGSARARDFLAWGAKLDRPAFGAVVVLWRGAPAGESGHVGFYVGENDTDVFLWGGNQNNRVGVEAFPKARVLSYRWPTEVAR